MTRKDYIAIASVIVSAKNNPNHYYVSGLSNAQYTEGVYSTAIALAEMLSKDNPRFDRERFLNACGI